MRAGFTVRATERRRRKTDGTFIKLLGCGRGSDTSLALVDWLLGRAKKGVVMCSALTAPQEGPAICGLADSLPVQKAQ